MNHVINSKTFSKTPSQLLFNLLHGGQTSVYFVIPGNSTLSELQVEYFISPASKIESTEVNKTVLTFLICMCECRFLDAVDC